MSDNHNDNKHCKGSAYKKRSLFGRRQGRALGDERAGVMESIFPEIRIDKSLLTERYETYPSNIFDHQYSNYWLEIGFGYGEHIAALARNNPDTGYIGAEPFVNGMAAFAKSIKNEINNGAFSNIKALMDDGLIIARSLKPASIDGIYILNPDPWHKTRHHKRRIINQQNLDIFSKIIKPKGKLIITTDVEDLAQWMCTHCINHPDFEWKAQCKNDWLIPPSDWIKTRYEEKGAKGSKKMAYLFFERKS